MVAHAIDNELSDEDWVEFGRVLDSAITASYNGDSEIAADVLLRIGKTTLCVKLSTNAAELSVTFSCEALQGQDCPLWLQAEWFKSEQRTEPDYTTGARFRYDGRKRIYLAKILYSTNPYGETTKTLRFDWYVECR